MYFLAKFCRICIQSGDILVDLNTVDFDEIKLSEKLEICTKMVVTKENLSSEICGLCLAKLRVSYEFNDMCKKSHKKLQGYLKAILSKSNDEKLEDFISTDLNVVVTPLREYEDDCYISDNADSEDKQNEMLHFKEKRKRITKEQRCSLLKRLLTHNEPQKKSHDKYSYNNYYKSNFSDCNVKGGLRNIIDFTRNYEFGNTKCSNKQYTHLDKLKAFSEQFFKTDFSDFKNTILYIIENKDNFYDSGDSEDDLFSSPDEDESDSKGDIFKFEEVIVEPDLKIKTEMDFEEEGECAPFECYGEYGDNSVIKMEEDDPPGEDKVTETSNIYLNEYYSNKPFTTSDNSMQILNNFVGSYSHRRTFFSNNIRCRTRDNPYINPMLKEQFLYRSFRCDKCSRYFKSQGYLKAHYTKIH